jgi:hypothetical protein
MQCFFEVGLFTGAVWLGVLNNQSAANQIALSFTLYVYVRYLCSRYHSSW